MKIKKIKDVMKILRDLEEYTGDNFLSFELLLDGSGSIRNSNDGYLIVFNSLDELEDRIKIYKNR